MTRRYITYIVAPPPKPASHVLFTSDELALQERRIHHFLQETPGELCGTFVEDSPQGSCRHRSRWPELTQAIKACLDHQAHLLIGEIRNLTQNDAFATLIQNFLAKSENQPLQIYCLDQPYITRLNFQAIVEHTREQRKYHGKLIKEGLERAHAHPGNPHAAEVINQVNKPKIDNAIAFSLLMMPIIFDYQQNHYSQRKMVDMLNLEGYTAPEGGQWVLSQLQKVLTRIKINEVALALEKQFLKFQEKDLEPEIIAEELNQQRIMPPKGKQWNSALVEQVQTRIQQIHDIIRLNELIIELKPLIEDYHIDNFNADLLQNEFEKVGILLPKQWQSTGIEESRHGR